MHLMLPTAVAVPATAIAYAGVEAEDIGEVVAPPVALMQSSLQLRRHLHVCQLLTSLHKLIDVKWVAETAATNVFRNHAGGRQYCLSGQLVWSCNLSTAMKFCVRLVAKPHDSCAVTCRGQSSDALQNSASTTTSLSHHSQL